MDMKRKISDLYPQRIKVFCVLDTRNKTQCEIARDLGILMSCFLKTKRSIKRQALGLDDKNKVVTKGKKMKGANPVESGSEPVDYSKPEPMVSLCLIIF